VISPKSLEREGCRRDKVARILKELRASGHLQAKARRNERGRFQGVVYSFFECPPETGLPDTGLPETGLPDAVKQHLQSNKGESSKKNQKNLSLGQKQQQQQKTGGGEIPDVVQVVLGDKAERMVLKFGVERVATVCQRAQGKDFPCGWAMQALGKNWEVRSAKEINAARALDPERFEKSAFAAWVES